MPLLQVVLSEESTRLIYELCERTGTDPQTAVSACVAEQALELYPCKTGEAVLSFAVDELIVQAEAYCEAAGISGEPILRGLDMLRQGDPAGLGVDPAVLHDMLQAMPVTNAIQDAFKLVCQYVLAARLLQSRRRAEADGEMNL